LEVPPVNELERMLAGILKPKTPAITNDVVDRYQGMTDQITITDWLATSSGIPEGRVGNAKAGYSEADGGSPTLPLNSFGGGTFGSGVFGQ
jgi:hypothetical protein